MIVSDFLVIGGGMAGISAAYELSKLGKTIVLEKESTTGYHATGRSSAIYDESYGHIEVNRLAVASREFLHHPPDGFAEQPFLTDRGVLIIAQSEQSQQLDEFYQRVQPLVKNLRSLDAQQMRQHMPFLSDDYQLAILSPGCKDMDVNAQLLGYQQLFKRAGGQIVTHEELQSASFKQGLWHVQGNRDTYQSPIVINAGGAWADAIATRCGLKPLSLSPMKRSVFCFTFELSEKLQNVPLVMDIEETFYLKPDAGIFLGTLADEQPSLACDVQVDDLDIAIGVDRIERATGLTVHKVINQWAGLRTFSNDRIPVIGEDPKNKGFFWLAGQGGYGIMTAPANAMLLSSLVSKDSLAPCLLEAGVRPLDYSPRRFEVS